MAVRYGDTFKVVNGSRHSRCLGKLDLWTRKQSKKGQNMTRINYWLHFDLSKEI